MQDKAGEEIYKYRWVILTALWSTYMSSCIARLAIPALSTYIKADLEISHIQIGLLMSASQIASILIKIPAGLIIDAAGVRNLILIGKISAGVFLALVFITSSFNGLMWFMMLSGIGGGLIGSVSYKAILYWFPQKERGTAVGISSTAFNIGGAIGAAVLPPIALALTWRHGFLISGSFVAVIGILAFILYRTHPKEPKFSEAKFLINRQFFKDILMNKNLILLGLSGMLFCVLEFSLITYIYLYMDEALGISAAVTGLAFLSVAEWGGAISKPLFGFISDRFFNGKRNLSQMVIMILGIAMTAVITHLSPDNPTWVIVIIFFFLGLGLFGWSGLNTTLMAEFSGREKAGTGVGFGFIMHNIGQITGPPLFGYIVDNSSYRVAWYFLIICGVIGVILLSFVRESQRKA
ncbi:MFS transporter [Chloroflexota bacterium]